MLALVTSGLGHGGWAKAWSSLVHGRWAHHLGNIGYTCLQLVTTMLRCFTARLFAHQDVLQPVAIRNTSKLYCDRDGLELARLNPYARAFQDDKDPPRANLKISPSRCKRIDPWGASGVSGVMIDGRHRAPEM